MFSAPTVIGGLFVLFFGFVIALGGWHILQGTLAITQRSYQRGCAQALLGLTFWALLLLLLFWMLITVRGY